MPMAAGDAKAPAERARTSVLSPRMAGPVPAPTTLQAITVPKYLLPAARLAKVSSWASRSVQPILSKLLPALPSLHPRRSRSHSHLTHPEPVQRRLSLKTVTALLSAWQLMPKLAPLQRHLQLYRRIHPNIPKLLLNWRERTPPGRWSTIRRIALMQPKRRRSLPRNKAHRRAPRQESHHSTTACPRSNS